MSNSVYEIVTQKIVDALAKGVCPWQKPWKSIQPMNAITNKAYRGINSILLGMSGYSDPRFLTFRQVESLGGKVAKGSRAELIVFWKMNEKGVEHEDCEQATMRNIPTLRYYNVFNVSQCTGLLTSEGGKLAELSEITRSKDISPIAAAEEIVSNMQNTPQIKHGNEMAAYIPSKDLVVMPNKTDFNTMAGYYGVLLHELTHSTGHTSRLCRPGVVNPIKFGSENYAQEELVAEIGSAFLMAEAGIEPNINNSASYLDGWRKAISEDKRLIIRAASQAQKAAEYVISG